MSEPQYPPQPQAYYQMPPMASPEPVAPDGRPLAGPGQRLGARVIDSLIQAVGFSVVAGVFGGGVAALLINTVGDDSPAVPIAAVTTMVLAILIFQYLYEVELPLRWHGQTPGKRMLKLAVIPLEPYAALDRGRLAYRYVVMLGFNLLSNCYVGMIDPLWCLWDKPYRQCLHDKPAKTVVIRLPAA